MKLCDGEKEASLREDEKGGSAGGRPPALHRIMRSMLLSQEADSIHTATRASSPPFFRILSASASILRNELIHDLAAGETAPGRYVLAHESTAPIL